MKSLAAGAPCPCARTEGGRALAYGTCCRPLHDGWAVGGPYAATAERLMRSRYSAFVLENGPYLQGTWASTERPHTLDFEAGIKWLGLAIRAVVQTGDNQAEVEFVARYKPAQGPAVRLHERSRFVREDGRWWYVDGDQFE